MRAAAKKMVAPKAVAAQTDDGGDAAVVADTGAATGPEITGDGSGQALPPIESSPQFVERDGDGVDELSPAPLPQQVDEPPPASASPAAAQALERSDYLVVSPLELDGVRYAPTRPVQLTASQAAPLLGHTVVPKA